VFALHYQGPARKLAKIVDSFDTADTTTDPPPIAG
jgi:hypothetical protein